MAANRFRAPKHPRTSKVARGGMTDDKTERAMAFREAARSAGYYVNEEWLPALYTPPARRSRPLMTQEPW